MAKLGLNWISKLSKPKFGDAIEYECEFVIVNVNANVG